jgi:hypothetical protein
MKQLTLQDTFKNIKDVLLTKVAILAVTVQLQAFIR